MPLIWSVQVHDCWGAQQEFNLLARHADFQLFNQARVDPVTLRDIHSIHAAGECYNDASPDQDSSNKFKIHTADCREGRRDNTAPTDMLQIL